MMGEFIIYYRGKIVGGIYDDRLLVKPTKSAISYMPTVTYEVILRLFFLPTGFSGSGSSNPNASKAFSCCGAISPY